MYVIHFKNCSLMVNVLTVSYIQDHPKMEKNVFQLNVVKMKYN